MLRLEDVRIMRQEFVIDVNLELCPGSRTALIGPSGGGKSTLLAAVAGFLPVQSGRVSIGGHPMEGVVPGERPLSMVFQDNNLFPHMTAWQNVGLGIRCSLRLASNERKRVDQALRRVGLGAHAGKRPGQLSGGQQSRVALARILIQRRPWILLDEPFAALGPALRTEMLELVCACCNDTAAGLVMVTHDPRDAISICEQTVVVANGRTSSPARTTELFASPPSDLSTYLGPDWNYGD